MTSDDDAPPHRPIFLPFGDYIPSVAASAYIAPGAALIGDVVIGPESSVWFNTTIRGDVMPIRIGARTSIQDNSVIHATEGWAPTVVGEDCVVGHNVILHGCTLGDRVLVGMGSILLDAVEVGSDVLIGAGSLVTARTKLPSGVLVMGDRPGSKESSPTSNGNPSSAEPCTTYRRQPRIAAGESYGFRKGEVRKPAAANLRFTNLRFGNECGSEICGSQTCGFGKGAVRKRVRARPPRIPPSLFSSRPISSPEPATDLGRTQRSVSWPGGKLLRAAAYASRGFRSQWACRRAEPTALSPRASS